MLTARLGLDTAGRRPHGARRLQQMAGRLGITGWPTSIGHCGGRAMASIILVRTAKICTLLELCQVPSQAGAPRRERHCSRCSRAAASNSSSSMFQIESLDSPRARYERFATSWPRRTSGTSSLNSARTCKASCALDRSWRFFPDSRKIRPGRREMADDLHRHGLIGEELGYAGRPCDTIIND